MRLSRLLILSALTIFLASCEKDNCEPETPPPPPPPAVPKTRTELLTAKTWMYDEYFRNYNSTNTILYYKRGKANNLINMDVQRNTFRADGTYSEILANGSTASGTWRFINNETQIQVNTPIGVFTSTIIALDETKFHWLEPNADNGTFGKMIPQP